VSFIYYPRKGGWPFYQTVCMFCGSFKDVEVNGDPGTTRTPNLVISRLLKKSVLDAV